MRTAATRYLQIYDHPACAACQAGADAADRGPVFDDYAIPQCNKSVLPDMLKAAISLRLTGPKHFDIFRNMKSMDAVDSLAALAQESRLAIFRMLVKRGPAGYTPTQLGEKLHVSSPTLSFHLKELQRAGLVAAHREGRFLYYRPNLTHMNQLIGFLTENCCALADQQCGPGCVPA
jgi:DNA-binding transcriptional ArsR family regulator